MKHAFVASWENGLEFRELKYLNLSLKDHAWRHNLVSEAYNVSFLDNIFILFFDVQ